MTFRSTDHCRLSTVSPESAYAESIRNVMRPAHKSRAQCLRQLTSTGPSVQCSVHRDSHLLDTISCDEQKSNCHRFRNMASQVRQHINKRANEIYFRLALCPMTLLHYFSSFLLNAHYSIFPIFSLLPSSFNCFCLLNCLFNLSSAFEY